MTSKGLLLSERPAAGVPASWRSALCGRELRPCLTGRLPGDLTVTWAPGVEPDHGPSLGQAEDTSATLVPMPRCLQKPPGVSVMSLCPRMGLGHTVRAATGLSGVSQDWGLLPYNILLLWTRVGVAPPWCPVRLWPPRQQASVRSSGCWEGWIGGAALSTEGVAHPPQECVESS